MVGLDASLVSCGLAQSEIGTSLDYGKNRIQLNQESCCAAFYAGTYSPGNSGWPGL